MFKGTFVHLGFFSLSKHCPTSQCEQSHSRILSNYLFCSNFTKSFINIVFNWITRKIDFFRCEDSNRIIEGVPPYCGSGLDSLEPISISGQWSESYWINPKCKSFKAIETGVILLKGLKRTGHMSFLTGQDRTPKFPGQVLLDQTKSGLPFLNILHTK